MKLGVVADDFTGASDIDLALSEDGMQTAQFVGVPLRAAVLTADHFNRIADRFNVDWT